MVRVNRNALPKADLERLFSQLSSVLGTLDSDSADIFITELLGPEEKLTLAKRLAALLLLIEGYSQYKTARLLKLSPSTTEKISRRLKKGEFSGILKTLGKNKRNYFALLTTLDSILHLGGILPHYNGIERYKF